MKNILNKKLIQRYSRQIILKDVGPIGQKKIINSKVLVVGAGGLGCPVIDYLSRAGVGNIGIVDNDKVNISNIHRQSLYTSKDVGKFKVNIAKKKVKLINPQIKIKTFKVRIDNKNIEKIFKNYYFIVDYKNKNNPCLKCFYQTEPSDEILNCEYEGILGPVAGIVGNIQAIEVLKKILKIGDNSSKKILILDLSKLDFRRVEFKKKTSCICKK